MRFLSIWRLSRSELLSTFFPTWIWQGLEWSEWRIPKHDPYYWGNAHAHPVLSTYYPPSAITAFLFNTATLDKAFIGYISLLFSHIIFGFVGYFWLFRTWADPLPSLFGALTCTFGAYSLKQQPCIIYTLAWFPLTLQQDPMVSTLALGMMLLAGYYPFSIYLLPIAVISHILWYREAWLLTGVIIGLPQIIPFLKYLPKTVKRLDDKCEESPEVERRFYVGVIPIMLLPFSTSRIWPIAIVSAVFSLGILRHVFPRIHERWLIVLQFCLGWMAVSALNNLNLATTTMCVMVFVHAFDLFWHNRTCLPATPWVELWDRPSRAFRRTRFMRELMNELKDSDFKFKVAGLPYPLFTGHIHGIRTIGYCGSMQTKEMWAWRKSFKHDPFIDGVNHDDLTRNGVKYAVTRKRPDRWNKVYGTKNLYRNPDP